MICQSWKPTESRRGSKMSLVVPAANTDRCGSSQQNIARESVKTTITRRILRSQPDKTGWSLFMPVEMTLCQVMVSDMSAAENMMSVFCRFDIAVAVDN
ncbi:hypothetical protein KCV07_g454, partial [Aureobasidium melanogenum]